MNRQIQAPRDSDIDDDYEDVWVDVLSITMGHQEFGSWMTGDSFDADGDDLEVRARTEIQDGEWGVKISVDRELPRDVVARMLRKAADLFDGPNEEQMNALARGDDGRCFARRRPDGTICVTESCMTFYEEVFPEMCEAIRRGTQA